MVHQLLLSDSINLGIHASFKALNIIIVSVSYFQLCRLQDEYFLPYIASFNKACSIRRSELGMEVLAPDVLQLPWQQS